MKIYFNNLKSKKSGFTLVETLVAVTIFSVSVVGLMSVLGRGISDTNYAKKKVTATYLAQEGIEYIRNLRDTHVLYSSTVAAGWSAFNTALSNASCQAANGCYFNDQNVNYSNSNKPITSLIIGACSSSCPELLYDSSISKYGYVSGTASGFSRKINFTQINANETKVTSTVTWTQGSGTYNVSFSENLFNWVE